MVKRQPPYFIEIDPSIVYFTHARIRSTFSGCGRKVEETLDEIINGKLKPADLPFITVMYDGSVYYSLNNRRLWVLKQCKERGLVDHIRVRVRPEDKGTIKYSQETCVLHAKLAMK